MAVLTQNGNIIGKSSANDGVLTIQKNGTTVATFSANQSGNSLANISDPTKLSDLTDDVVSGNYVKLNSASAQMITTNSDTPFILNRNIANSNVFLCFRNANNILGYYGVDNSSKPTYIGNDDVAKEIALKEDVVKLSNTEAQTITSSNTSAPIILKSNNTNASWIGFKTSDDIIKGYLGLYTNNKPFVMDSQGTTKEIALVDNTVPCKTFTTNIGGVGWHKIFTISASNSQTFLISWQQQYNYRLPTTGSAILSVANGDIKLIPLSFAKPTYVQSITKVRISNLTSYGCQVDVYYDHANANSLNNIKIIPLSGGTDTITILDGSLDTSASAQEISAGDKVLTNLSGVQTTVASVQTINQTDSTNRAVLALQGSATAGPLLSFKDSNGGYIGHFGISITDRKPIYREAGQDDKEIALVSNTPIEVPMTYASVSDTLPNVVKAWLQYICKNYPGLAYKTFVGTISYNGAYRVSAIIYNTDTHDDNYTPQYAWGEMQLMTTMYIFSCSSYTITTKQVQLMS